MRRIVFAAAIAALAIGCHSVLVGFERRGSAGIVNRTAEPRHDFFDHHPIAFPAKPFVNCFDLLQPDLPVNPCERGPGQAGLDLAGYVRDYVPAAVEAEIPIWLRRSDYSTERKYVDAIAAKFEPSVPHGNASGFTPVSITVHAVQSSSQSAATELNVELAAADAATLFARAEALDVIVRKPGGRSARLGRIARVGSKVTLTVGQSPDGTRLELFPASAAPPDLMLPQPVVSFVHLSDVQIREPAATLGGQEVSDTLDPLIQSFAHDYEQELYSAFVYEAFVQTINAEVHVHAGKGTAAPEPDAYRPAPTFVIHTGDAIDTGLRSEFDEFLRRSDGLALPWYDVVGNHDVLGFGNLLLTPVAGEEEVDDDDKIACTQTSTLLREFYLKRPEGSGWAKQLEAERTVNSKPFSLAPVILKRICLRLKVANDELLAAPVDKDDHLDGIDRFIAAHCRPKPGGGCADPPSAGAYALREGDKGDKTPSVQNGFDLHPKKRGYYAFALDAPALGAGRRVWIVVLNTSSLAGAFGAVQKEQLDWLKGILVDRKQVANVGASIDPHDVVLVFGHHPLWNIEAPEQRARLQRILFNAGNVPAYFAGHTHSPQLRAVEDDPKATGRRLWEVIAPSIIGFPQQARQVTMRVLPGTKLAYLEILTFEPHLKGDQQEYVIAGNRGAERDQCDQYPGSCRGGKPIAPPTNVIFPRLFFRLP